jgi:hypothetical protein
MPFIIDKTSMLCEWPQWSKYHSKQRLEAIQSIQAAHIAFSHKHYYKRYVLINAKYAKWSCAICTCAIYIHLSAKYYPTNAFLCSNCYSIYKSNKNALHKIVKPTSTAFFNHVKTRIIVNSTNALRRHISTLT